MIIKDDKDKNLGILLLGNDVLNQAILCIQNLSKPLKVGVFECIDHMWKKVGCSLYT